MELTNEEIEFIRAVSREIEFGKITIKITGPPSNIVDIIPEKTVRFERHKKTAKTRVKTQSPGSCGGVFP